MDGSEVLRKGFAGEAIALCACFAGLSCCMQAFSNSPQPSATPAVLDTVEPVLGCASLTAIGISGVVGAKTHITSASPVTDAKPAPYCRVTGYVEPMVKFEVRLPLAGWTQRFVQTGCGGLCGNLNIRLGNADGCYPADHGELALASTDMGHSGGMDGEFGEKDYQLRIDFAYRGIHVTTLAAKALIVAYYGQPAKYSYFSGCSDGGREALMEAERYPEDFNGITAGAPAMNFTTQNTFYHGWNAIRNTSADGKPILTADKLPILHEAALRACDAADGLKDGLISDPLSCHVDPALVECKPGRDEKTCLTPPQVQTARDIYAGAHDSNGDKLVLSGPLPGSELAWQGVYIPTAGNDHTMSPIISASTLKYLAYQKNPPSDYRLEDLRFTSDSFTATTRLHALYDATDPDLSAFAKRGGKLILWHGLADPHISPLNSIAYYTAMSDVMGETEVRKFARLYLFPGGYHCSGGEGPFHFDLMSSIMAWVERGTAPFAIVASREPGGVRGPVASLSFGTPPGSGQGMTGPLPGMSGPPFSGRGMPPMPQGGGRNGPQSLAEKSANADHTRPVYPYPLTAAYNGSGSVDDARNFSPGRAKPASALDLQWLGASFYRPHYELWCTGDGAAMVCKPTP